jgi:lipoteichoic acid synthase
LAEWAYTTVPRTSKAILSVNCGIQPHLVEEITEARRGGIPSRGLADLLKEQRYSTAFFQSSTENFENFRDLVENFGYAKYYPLESFDEEYKEGFEWANYFGYEDDIMLKPSEEWLKKHRDQPLMVTYLTGTGHDDYQTPLRYGYENFSKDDLLNRYLNCLRY